MLTLPTHGAAACVRPRMRTLGLAALVAALVAALTAGPPGDASIASGQVVEAAAGAIGEDRGSVGQRQVITLITGDKVTLTQAPGGRDEIDIEAANRPAGAPPVAFGVMRSPGGDIHVIPSDAELLVAKGVLERDLFNVGWLTEHDYADGVRSYLPLIIEYRSQLSTKQQQLRAETLPGSEVTHSLESFDAAAIRMTKSTAQSFWRSLVGAPALDLPRAPQQAGAFEQLATGATRVWLDRTVHASLDQSVAQIGAPEVWAAGYDGTGVTVAVLDTGVDAAHPDLTGKVVATQSFIPGQTVADGHGHGTHVAATIAGTGQGSDGLRNGVAPGADLVVGKVLNDAGTGPASAVIEGMEWAAFDQDADIVSMSLGACCTDGSDPMSRAVNEISAATGTLFVIAAGNDGSGAATVGTPGTAEAALTVGAVDKSDTLASFSSRGPRRGDGLIKPDITAPGVNIVAARATGTSLGSPVDSLYTRASGTSMATPHVAGAAALLAQANPDWNDEQIKSALTGTADPGDYAVHEQGTGRVDAARAFGQRLHASPATVHLGSFTPGEPAEPVTRTLTYSNDTDAPVTIALTLDVRDHANRPVEIHGISLSTDQLTIPARAASGVVVELDPTAAASGPIGAVVSATSADGRMITRTAVGYYQGPESHHVTVEVMDSTGAPAADVVVSMLRIDDTALAGHDPLVAPVFDAVTDGAGEASFIVPEGIYDISGQIDESSTLTTPQRTTFAHVVERRVSADTTVTLEAEGSVPLKPATGAATEQRAFKMSTSRLTEAGNIWQSMEVRFQPRLSQNWYATPTDRARIGRVEFSQRWDLHKPLVEVSVSRPGRDLPLHPNRDGTIYAAAEVEGDHVYDLVLASVSITLEGLPEDPFEALLELQRRVAEDLAGLDVEGKAVLLRIDGSSALLAVEIASFFAVQLLVQAGAVAALSYADVPGAIAGALDPGRRDFSLSYAEGNALRRLLSEGRTTKVRIKGTLTSPLVYQLHLRQGALPATRPRVDTRDLVRVDATYRNDRRRPEDVPWQPENREGRASWGPLDLFDTSNGFPNYQPARRIEYIGPADEEVLWSRHVAAYSPWPFKTYNVFTRPDRTEEDWFQSPMYFGVSRQDRSNLDDGSFWCAYCRDGDFFWAEQRELLDGGTITHTALRVLVEFFEPTTSVRLFSDGREIPESSRPFGSGEIRGFELSAEPALYTLEQVDTVTTEKVMSPRVATTWTFRSERPEPGLALQPRVYVCPFSPEENCAFEPLIMLDYDLDGLDLANRAPADEKWRFTIEPYHVAPDSPRITGVKVWSSTDGGETWDRADVNRAHHGQYRVRVRHPDLDETDGFVWLRVEARDAAGNTVTQITERAYGLR